MTPESKERYLLLLAGLVMKWACEQPKRCVIWVSVMLLTSATMIWSAL